MSGSIGTRLARLAQRKGTHVHKAVALARRLHFAEESTEDERLIVVRATQHVLIEAGLDPATMTVDDLRCFMERSGPNTRALVVQGLRLLRQAQRAAHDTAPPAH